jgi:hypothetical protein
MSKFVVPRLRDAFGVIRGFVYQIDLTIDRWLGLRENESLELERGEDIDTVIRAVGGDEEAARLLEQVKYRDRSITLRSPEVIEALVNAVGHLQENPDVVLNFQFTTNATVGIERPSALRGGGPAIIAWEAVRLGRLHGAQLEVTLTAIKTLLASRQKPEKVPDKSWAQFRVVVDAADNVQISRLIRGFSWSTRVPESGSIRESLQAKLVAIGHAPTTGIAAQQYQRLFMHVLNLLTKPGLKQLDQKTWSGSFRCRRSIGTSNARWLASSHE